MDLGRVAQRLWEEKGREDKTVRTVYCMKEESIFKKNTNNKKGYYDTFSYLWSRWLSQKNNEVQNFLSKVLLPYKNG